MHSTFATVERELRAKIAGDVWFDEEKRTEYSTATCMYKVMPVGVVAPKNLEDVQNVVRLCADLGIAVIPRGGATGLAGQAVGFGIILDFARHMNHIGMLSEDLSSVSVEAGCILNDLYAFLQPHGLFYPVDPQSANHCTVGGTIATNAAGSHGLKYGSTKNQIRSLSLVLSNGDAAVVNPEEKNNRLTPEGRVRFSGVKNILGQNRHIIEKHMPAVEKSSSGYNIFESLRDGNFDATRLLCGSEGTLAIITGATISVCPFPKAKVAAVAYFSSYEATAEGILLARKNSPSAIELLDKSYTEIGKGLSPKSDRFIAGDFQTMLLIEFEGDERSLLFDSAEALHRALRDAGILLRWSSVETESERESLWSLREAVSERLNHLPSQERKISTIEDGAVPLKNLPAYLAGLKSILNRHSIPFTLYGHAGAGHIHCTTLVDIETRSGRDRIDRATQEVFDLLISLNGTLSAEHGDGFVRTPFLEHAFGTEVYSLFRSVKETLDPQNMLNPEKIVGRQNRSFLHDIKYA